MAKGKADLPKLLAAVPAFRLPALEIEVAAADVGTVVDRLGRLAAIKSEIKRYEDDLKEIVLENGAPIVGGNIVETLDVKAIQEAMDERWLKKYTRRKRSSKSVRINARKGLEADAA